MDMHVRFTGVSGKAAVSLAPPMRANADRLSFRLLFFDVGQDFVECHVSDG